MANLLFHICFTQIYSQNTTLYVGIQIGWKGNTPECLSTVYPCSIKESARLFISRSLLHIISCFLFIFDSFHLAKPAIVSFVPLTLRYIIYHNKNQTLSVTLIQVCFTLTLCNLMKQISQNSFQISQVAKKSPELHWKSLLKRCWISQITRILPLA